VCYSVLQCAVYHSFSRCVAVCYSVLQYVTECYSVLQCVAVHQALRLLTMTIVIGAVCCRVLPCVAVSVYHALRLPTMTVELA